MTVNQGRPATVPTDPKQLADALLAPGMVYADLVARLAAQIGGRSARRLLAVAHGVAADRLSAEA
jgi:hypothetical protein